MIKRIFLITLAMALVTVAQGQSIESKKCKTCGKPLKECQYKGRHPQKDAMQQSPNRKPVGADHPNNRTQNISSNNSSYRSSVKSKKIKVGDVEFTMVYVEGGDYLMGVQRTKKDSPNYEPDAPFESTVHKETVKDFYIGQTEVTQELWKAVTGMTLQQHHEIAIEKEDEWYKKRIPWNYTIIGEGDDYPMYYIGKDEVINFIEKLNRLTGEKFRLPTESEWEYAARGGNQSKGYLYSGANNINDVAWYNGNSDSLIHPVAQKQPNELGLYDMNGNVWEMCADCWKTDFIDGPTDCRGYPIRGGGAWEKKESCTPSRRMGAGTRDMGFRLAMDR